MGILLILVYLNIFQYTFKRKSWSFLVLNYYFFFNQLFFFNGLLLLWFFLEDRLQTVIFEIKCNHYMFAKYSQYGYILYNICVWNSHNILMVKILIMYCLGIFVYWNDVLICLQIISNMFIFCLIYAYVMRIINW